MAYAFPLSLYIPPSSVWKYLYFMSPQILQTLDLDILCGSGLILNKHGLFHYTCGCTDEGTTPNHPQQAQRMPGLRLWRPWSKRKPAKAICPRIPAKPHNCKSMTLVIHLWTIYFTSQSWLLGLSYLVYSQICPKTFEGFNQTPGSKCSL